MTWNKQRDGSLWPAVPIFSKNTSSTPDYMYHRFDLSKLTTSAFVLRLLFFALFIYKNIVLLSIFLFIFAIQKKIVLSSKYNITGKKAWCLPVPLCAPPFIINNLPGCIFEIVLAVQRWIHVVWIRNGGWLWNAGNSVEVVASIQILCVLIGKVCFLFFDELTIVQSIFLSLENKSPANSNFGNAVSSFRRHFEGRSLEW